MWIVFVISLITIPLFYYFDNRQISETELSIIDNLTLSQNPDYTSGKRPKINIYLKNTERILVVNLEELNCVDKDDILKNLKEKDTISIKILKSDLAEFNEIGIISKYQKLYGLSKNEREYIKLSCRNKISNVKTIAATYASFVSAILSLILALFVFKPKITYERKGFLYNDPITIICLCWFLVTIIALLISK